MLDARLTQSVGPLSTSTQIPTLSYTPPTQGLPFPSIPFPQPLIPIKTRHVSHVLLAPSLGSLAFSLYCYWSELCQMPLAELSHLSTLKSFFSTTSWGSHVLLSCQSCPYLSVFCYGLFYKLSDLGVYLCFCVFISIYHVKVTMVLSSFLLHSSTFFVSYTTSWMHLNWKYGQNSHKVTMSHSLYPPMAYFHSLPALLTSEIAFLKLGRRLSGWRHLMPSLMTWVEFPGPAW